MTARKLLDLNTDLEETGFVQIDSEHYRWDSVGGKSALRQELPWQIVSWDLEAKSDAIYQESFAAKLDAESFVKNCEEQLTERFPAFRKITLQEDKKSGFWLLIEFLDDTLDVDQSRLIEDEDAIQTGLPHGLAGLHISVIHAVGQISIFMTKHYFLGNVPGPLFIEMPKLLNKALFGTALSAKTNFNAYLLTLRSEDLRSSLIDYCQFPDSFRENFRETDPDEMTFGQVRLSFSAKDWLLNWAHGQEVPELLVPPMEILEQKEVAKRFQKLDELILFEDLPAAQRQCKEFLEKNPQSLYLIRRWAFLTLWSDIEFDQKYLDLMIKFDPNNLMTLSLWVRKGVQDMNSDIMLENLSKLGSTLGLAITDFDSLDITSLTLPEMLGDAWNQKEDERAVNCYERVLNARGEIPRILVKLIRLMRDIDDPVTEEAYMDRLLACDVPTRTRAAIYYRLAEIKQRSDVADACEWALKSWHTNRAQVRYAILAADLLIQLGRPHDAAHVLVETSEQLEHATVADHKLALEVKIASIWLENMQRLDLASERITRAMELLTDDDIDALDTIITLVQKLDDLPQLLQVLTRGLQVANGLADLERSTKFVHMLLAIADANPERTSEIYSIALSNALIGAGLTESLLQKEGLNLPFMEIIESMETRVDALDQAEQGSYYQLLGDMAQDRIDNTARALDFYEKALKDNVLTPRSFEFLDRYYSRMGLNAQRYALLQRKLSNSKNAEKALLLRELFYFDEGVSDAEKDSYAIQILAIDSDDVRPIEERMAFYEQNQQGDAVLQIIQHLSPQSIQPSVIGGLVRFALSAVKSMNHPNRHLWLMQLIGKLKEVDENHLEIARLTIQNLWDAEEKTWVREPLALLIGQGEIPDLPPAEMLAVLDDDSLKVDLLYQLSERSKTPEEVLAFEKDALHLVKDLPMMMVKKLEIQRRLAAKIEFAVPEFAQFLRECESMGRDSENLQILLSQLRLSSHADHKKYILTQIENALTQRTIEGENAKSLAETLSLLPITETLGLRLVWRDRLGVNPILHNLNFFEAIIGNADYWNDQPLIIALIDHGMTLADSSMEVRVAINRFISSLLDDKHESLLRFYVKHEAIAPLLDIQTTKMVAEYLLAKRDAEGFQYFWWETMKRLADRQEIIEFLQNSRRAFAALDLKKVFLDHLDRIIEHDSHLVDADVLFEVRLFYADYLIENNTANHKARSLLEGLYKDRGTDSRVWGGLIAIYRETSAESDLYEILHKVLPSLKEDPRPLKEYQLSVTGLELEFNELSVRMGLRSDSIISDRPRIPTGVPGPMDHLTMFGKGDGTVATAPAFDLEDLSQNFANTQIMPFPHEAPALPLADSTQHSDSSPDQDQYEPMPFNPESTYYNFGEDKSNLSEVTKARLPDGAQMQTRATENPAVDLMFVLSSDEESKPEPQEDGISLYDETNVFIPSVMPNAAPATLPKPPLLLLDEDEPGDGGAGVALDAFLGSPVHNDGRTMVSEEAKLKETVFSLEPSPVNPAPVPSFLYTSAIGPTPAPPPVANYSAPVANLPTTPPSPTGTVRTPAELSTAWRRMAHNTSREQGVLQALLDHPLPEITEQIIAVQVAALLEDQISKLDTIPYRVWRDPSALRYELKWTDRMNREMFHPGIKSPLARLLKALYPLFIQAFGHEMGITGVAERLRVRPEELMKVRKPLDWNDEMIQRSNMRYYTASLQDNGYHLYHLPSIGERFQFDFEKRDIYVDRTHYMAAPPSHIFHRLAFLLRAVSLDYFPFLHLSAGSEIFPFLMKCKRSLDQSESARRTLGKEKDPLRAILAQSKDRDFLVQLFTELGNFSADKISQTVSHFIEQIYRLNLAETLDLIGVIETISSVDLCNPKTSSYQRIAQSSSARSILTFAAELRFATKEHP